MTNKLYYYANNVYQFSNIMPVYRQLGGDFIVKKPTHYVRFKLYFNGQNAFQEKKNLLNTPPVIVRNPDKDLGINGILLSDSNKRLRYHPEKCKSIFVGHGTGDKTYGGNAKTLETYDYHFISGPKHLAKLEDMGINIPKERQVKVGSLRFDDYVNNKIDRKTIMDELGIVDRSRKTILYAPTWRYGNGTLMKYGFQFCRELTKKYNLIIRPHYHDRDKMTILQLKAFFLDIDHVYFSHPVRFRNNDTIEVFAVTDLMISDTSSIIYEYLITKNPIIIVQHNYEKLHSMPDEMNATTICDTYDGSKSIVDLVEENLAKNNRKVYEEMLNNCFYFNDGRCTDRAVEFLLQLKI